MLRKFDEIPRDANKRCVEEVIARIEDIESPEIGVIAAQDIIDIVTQNLGPYIYNIAVHDTKKVLRDKFDDLEYEIDSLEQAL